MWDKNNQISQESTKRDFKYINDNENNYSLKKEEIKNALNPLKNSLEYISKDKNYLEIYKQVECLKSNFIIMIDNLEPKINEKTSIPSKTVKNLGSYLLKFQTIKSKIKGEINKLKVDIPNLEKEIQNIHKNFKYASEKHKLNDEVVQKYNSLPSMKKELNKIKKQLPVLEKTLESTKDINRKIKNISINRFGVATIKTIDKYINNFILKFNGIIQKLDEVIEKKNYHLDDKISKIFSQNRSRLKHIKTQLDDSKTTDGLAYWYNRLDKIVNNQNPLNFISKPEFFDEYDSFLDTEIGTLKSQIEKLIEEMKNKLLEGSNIERDWKRYCDIIKNFRKKLLRYLYQDNQIKIGDYSLESLFTVGLIRAFSEIYSEDFGIIKFSKDKYSKGHFEFAKEDFTRGVLSTVFGVIVGISGCLLFGAALASGSFLFAFLGIGLGALAAVAGLVLVLSGSVMGGVGVYDYAIGAFSNKKYNDSKNFEISRSDKRYIKKIKRK